jgi:hypothetical protein
MRVAAAIIEALMFDRSFIEIIRMLEVVDKPAALGGSAIAVSEEFNGPSS